VPPKKKVQLSDDVRDAFKRQLADAKRVSDQATENFYVQVYLMNLSGLTFQEIAEIFGTRTSTVSDWKRKGEEAYAARESARSQEPGEDPLRPAEPLPLG
jgi:DNA-directed RNA polymerase specialized sigma24 family protein